ncbi:MAG: putative protein kinase [Frankiales bacterium]|nr:putative protein kinase [Frankiales bacterium]
MSDTATLAAALPGYDIGGELGRGGFGVVLAGTHKRLGRPVAIKELPPNLAGDAGVRARFVTEARVLASLDHPHIVPVYDYVEQDGLCLLVMESLPGGTVWSSFSGRGYTPQTACAVVLVACAGLHHAHGAGVLHRDVKPENLLFTEAGLLKVTDFGIAKVIGGSDALATTSGDILGTPAYMAPEQAEGKDVGPAADVYAAGVMLYELLSGQLPFSSEGGGLAIVYRHVFEDPTPLLMVAPTVPRPVAEVAMQALSRAASDRYPSAESFGVALGQAATSVFGPGWLQAAAVPLMAGGPILASTERFSVSAFASAPLAAATAVPDGRATLAGGLPVLHADRTNGSAPATGAPASGGPHALPPDGAVAAPDGSGNGRPVLTGPGASATSDGPFLVPSQRVHPSSALRVQGVLARDVSFDALVPVRQVLELPAWPAVPALVTAVLIAAAAVLSLVGTGAARPLGTFPRAVASVDGTDIAAGRDVRLDLGRPVPVRLGRLPASARGADELRLSFSMAGFPLVDSARATVRRLSPTQVGAELDARANRYLAVGLVDVELVLLKDGRELAREPFRARVVRPFYATVPGGLAVAALLFLLAYAEALLRPLRRRGRRRITSLVGLAVVGALLGALAAVFAWLSQRQPLTPTSAGACSVVGAAAGVALALTTTRAGRRARIRRVTRRLGLVRPSG